MKLRFCENNIGKRKVINKLLEKYPHMEIEIKKCLGKCGICSEAYVAEADGTTVFGKTSEELFTKLKRIMEEE